MSDGKQPGKYGAQFSTGIPIRYGRQPNTTSLRVDVNAASSARDREERVYLTKLAMELKLDVTGWEAVKLRDLRTTLLMSVQGMVIASVVPKTSASTESVLPFVDEEPKELVHPAPVDTRVDSTESKRRKK